MKDITTENKAAQVGRGALGWAGLDWGQPFGTMPMQRVSPRRPHPAACRCQPPQEHDTSVFLGLDTNRLARWDMRDPHGIVSQVGGGLVVCAAVGRWLRPRPAEQQHGWLLRMSRRLMARFACCSSCRQAASPIVNYAGGKDYARGTKFRCALLWVGCNVVLCGCQARQAAGQHGRVCCPPDQPRVPLRPALIGVQPICFALFRPLPMCSCMATSGDGYVVVGADDGKVSRDGQQGLVCGQPGQAGEPAGSHGREELVRDGAQWCPHPSFSLAHCVATPCPTCPRAGAAVQREDADPGQDVHPRHGPAHHQRGRHLRRCGGQRAA